MADERPDRRLVDYEGAADRYDRGRALRGRSIDLWRRAAVMQDSTPPLGPPALLRAHEWGEFGV